MSAGLHDFTCEQGATFLRVVTIVDSDGDPRPLSGCSARMMVRPHINSPERLLAISSTTGEIVIDGANGKLTITIEASVTAALTRGGVYDLEIEDANGTVDRVLQGDFILEKEVTKT